MPGARGSQFTGNGELFGWEGEPETQKLSPCQPKSTLSGVIPTMSASVISGQIPTSDTLFGPTGETRFTDHSVSGEAVILHLNRSASDAWEFQAPIDFPSQGLGFGPDASGHLPGILSPLAIHLGRQPVEEGWTQSVGPPLVTCPWRSHLEMIMSIDLAISNISQMASSTTIEPLLEESLTILLDQFVQLKRSYFKLQNSVQHPKQLSGGTYQHGQPGYLDSAYWLGGMG